MLPLLIKKINFKKFEKPFVLAKLKGCSAQLWLFIMKTRVMSIFMEFPRSDWNMKTGFSLATNT